MSVVLFQDEHLIAFFNRKFGHQHLSKKKKFGHQLQATSTYIKDLHVIPTTIQKWRQYLLGGFFIISTDHKSLKELLHRVIQMPDQQAYLHKLLGYNFRIKYKTGSSNKVVDALSRQFEDQSSLFSTANRPIANFFSVLHEENASQATPCSLITEKNSSL